MRLIKDDLWACLIEMPLQSIAFISSTAVNETHHNNKSLPPWADFSMRHIKDRQVPLMRDEERSCGYKAR